MTTNNRNVVLYELMSLDGFADDRLRHVEGLPVQGTYRLHG